MVIVDEFHNAAALSYVSSLEHVQPMELVGLTATRNEQMGSTSSTTSMGVSRRSCGYGNPIDQQYLVPFRNTAFMTGST
jgi:superfamily II DNA or RNA helicase